MKWKKFLPYLILIIIIPIAGEFQFYPVNLDFRVSFATPALLLTLLYFRDINAPLATYLVGISVTITRIILGLVAGHEFDYLFTYHAPVFAYYFSYGLLFHFVPFSDYMEKPYLIGFYACMLEIGASMAEIIARYFAFGFLITNDVLFTIFVAAVIRSTFVMGIFMLFLFYSLKMKEEDQRKKNDDTLMVISDLFVGMAQLKKSIDDAEKNTSECFKLSKSLREEGKLQLSRSLLNISGKIHENKKDAQRVYASLSNLIYKQDYKEVLPVFEIVKIVIKMNRSYATYLNKKISFKVNIYCPSIEFHSYFLLSILNNLISNAIESINEKGTIEISAYKREADNFVVFYVCDDGPGLEEQHHEIIFSPGFTTKYNDQGNPSNGIGLSYIKQIIEEHHGKIELVRSIKNEVTEFKFQLPVTLDMVKYCHIS